MSQEKSEIWALMQEMPFQTSAQWRRVRAFMTQAQQETPNSIGAPTQPNRRRMANLIIEEAIETCNALGFGLKFQCAGQQVEIEPENAKDFLQADRPNDMLETFDGCADLSVVTQGCLIGHGMPDMALFKLIDENNLAKFGPGGHVDTKTRKWIKPPGHKPPRLDLLIELLKEEGWNPQTTK